MTDRFEDDEPILGFKQINDTLDNAESKYTSLITGAVHYQVDKWWKAIAPALDTLDEKQIEKHPLSLTTGIQGVLLSGWREIFSTGSKDGIAEVNEIGLTEKEKSPRGLFNDCHSLLVEFSDYRRRVTPSLYGLGNPDFNSDRLDDVARFNSIDRSGVDKFIKRKPAFEVAYPPDQADLDVLDVDELREALNLRTQVLAEDLSQEVSDKIARVIKDSVDLHFVQGKEVQRLPLAARTKIRNKINGIIGYERQKQKDRGVVERDLPRTVIEIPGKVDAQGNAVVVRRAKMIASTELNAGYNLGRLQSYYRAGVTSVRWQAIGDNRTCEICTTRNGTVLPIAEVLKSGVDTARSGSKSAKYGGSEYVIPAHPFCRCAWQVATREESQDKLRGVAKVVSPKPLAKGWKNIGSAVNLISGVGTAGSIINAAARRTKERQLQEKAKQKARNRAIGAATGALSLGVLSLGLWSWLNRSKQVPLGDSLGTVKPGRGQQIDEGLASVLSEDAQARAIGSALIKSQGELAAAKQKRELELSKLPLTPEMLFRGRKFEELGWNEVKQRKYAAFINSGVDLKKVSDLELRTQFGLQAQDIAMVRDLGNKFQKDLVKTSPYQKLLPAAAVSPRWLAKYPWLADVKDMRELSIQQMLRKGLPEPDVLSIYNGIYNQTRSAAGIARVSVEERTLLSRINSLTTKEELAGLLQLPRNQTRIVNSLFAKLQRYKAQDRKITSLTELRVRGVGDATIARMLASAKGKIRINELFLSSDRSLILERLKTITGVGEKTAEAIYETLLYTGTQFLGAYDMIGRIEQILNAKGQTLSAVAKRSFYNRLDFTYYPGFDRQALPPSSDFPTLPGFERRGDDPQPVTPGGSPPAQLGQPRANGSTPTKASSDTSQQPASAPSPRWNGARVTMASNQVIAAENKIKNTLAKEIRLTKAAPSSRQTLGDRLVKTEQKVSQALERDANQIRAEQRRQASELLENMDSAIANLTDDLNQAIADPAIDDVFDRSGRLNRTYRNQINQGIGQIETAIANINVSQNLSQAEQILLDRLKVDLGAIKQKAYEAEVGVRTNAQSSTNKTLEKALANSQQLIEQLESTPRELVPPEYPLQTNIDLLKLTQQKLRTLPNPVVEQIDALLQHIESRSIANIVNGRDRYLLDALMEQRQELINIRNKYV